MCVCEFTPRCDGEVRGKKYPRLGRGKLKKEPYTYLPAYRYVGRSIALSAPNFYSIHSTVFTVKNVRPARLVTLYI